MFMYNAHVTEQQDPIEKVSYSAIHPKLILLFILLLTIHAYYTNTILQATCFF